MSASLYSPLRYLILCSLRYYICISALFTTMSATLYSPILCLQLSVISAIMSAPLYSLLHVCTSVLSTTMSATIIGHKGDKASFAKILTFCIKNICHFYTNIILIKFCVKRYPDFLFVLLLKTHRCFHFCYLIGRT